MNITNAASEAQAEFALDKYNALIERQQKVIERLSGRPDKAEQLEEKKKRLAYFIENVTDANWILNFGHSYFIDDDPKAMEIYLNPKYYGEHR